MIATIADVLDSSWLRLLGYFVATGVTLMRYASERRLPRPRPIASWPLYWLLSAAVLLFLGVSRATALGDFVAELGREQARSEGWYDHGRRAVQTGVVVAVVLAWFLGVVLAIWRVPPRRRRYLPSVIAISSLVAFAAVRVVSLHHIDTVLYRRDIAGVRFVSIIELALLVVTIGAAVAVARLDEDPDGRHPATATATDSPGAPAERARER